MSGTYAEFWASRVAATPDAPFLVHAEARMTYGETDAWANRLAHGLRAAGVGAGDLVAVLLPSDLDLLRVELALAKLGAVAVPMIESLTRPEVEYVLGHCRPSRLITGARGRDLLGDPGIAVHDPAELVTDDASAVPAPGIGPMDPMAIMYTSGSTGRPKGVVQPSAGFATAGRAIAERLGLTAGDNALSALPLFHTAATHMLLAPAIAAGARFTLVPRFSRDRFWDQVREAGATHTLLMPAQLSILMTAEPSPRDREHPLRVAFSHIRPAAFCERFGVDVCTTWAMTETSGMGTLTAPGTTDHAPKLIGPPMPRDAEVRVVDALGRPVAPGELGELCFRHPHVMTAYFEDADNTAKTLVDGWVHSGDLCALDADGNVYFHGRLKHVIKRAGENVAGEEVEFAIMEHPAVEECIVVGVEDPIYTEEVHATVVVRDGQELSAEDVVRFCGERLTSWKVPRYVELRHEDLPKLANGKTDRRSIKAAIDPARAWDRMAVAR